MAEEKQDKTTKPEQADIPPAEPVDAADPAEPADQPESEFPEEIWVTDEDWVDEINTRWRDVIANLMNRMRIYEAYAKAYDIDITTPRGYNVARAAGSRLLTNVNFRKLWTKVLEEQGFNDETADMQLVDLMTNPEYDPKVRRAAVRDYNELRGRIIKNVDLKSDGKPIQAPAIISAIEPRDESAAQTDAAAGN